MSTTRVSHSETDVSGARQAKFLRALAHELRTPLGSIRMLAELLAAAPEAPAEKRTDKARKIERATLGIKEILDQVTILAKVADGSLEPVVTTLELAPFLADLLETHTAAAEAKGLDLTGTIEGAPPTISTDVDPLRQALDLLLAAAIATTADGRIETRVEVSPGDGSRDRVRDRAGGVRFTVRGGAPGIPESDHAAVLEPFAGGRKIRPTGVGPLDLPVAHAFAVLLGGRVELLADGEGTAFRLELPG